MANITTIFKSEPESSEDRDKLVDLFRNRAELKKAFAALRDEKYQLQDRVKVHEGATERVQQKLHHLESLLLDPEWVHSVVVFFQLRRLAAHCEARIERFSEELKQQREQRKRSKFLFAWNEERKRESDKVEERIGEHRMRVQTLEDQLQAARHELTAMGGITRMFRGRSQEEVVAEFEASIADAREIERGLLDELEEIEHREPPAPEGLDIAAKRSVNFMILAYAQQLYLDYADDNLAGLAKESSDKSVGAVNYGSKFECDKLLECLTTRRDEVGKSENSAEVLQALAVRAEMIAKYALFRHDDDAVPVPGTVATVFEIDPNGVVRQRDASLLGENYFGLAKVLSR